MEKRFSDLASEAREGWSVEAAQVGDAAARVFASEMDDREALGKALSALRAHRELTQPELFAASGVQQAEISRIERGLANPTVSTVEKLTHAMGGRLTVVFD